MDIEKIKKLIRLANNNPNEHEANLAARKACKLIEDNGKWTPFRNLSVDGPRTYNDIKRSTEPAWRAQPPYNPTGRNQYQEEWFRKWNDYWKEAEKNPVDGRPYESNFNDKETTPKSKPWAKDYPFTNEPKKKESATRNCTRCGLEVSTFRIKEVPFVCNVCHWKDLL